MTPTWPGSTDVRIAVIGAGFGGIGAGILLRQRGIEDFTILERADDLGGVWRDNEYPGCACDVPSHLYSYSFAPNPAWTHAFSRQPEIWAYLRDCADRYGVTPHIRTGHEVTAADWDDAAQRWRLATTQGTFTAQSLILAAGALSDPVIPALPGLAAFQGTSFHSAHWDHGYDLAGKRVAVVGTGASAIQFVPAIQPRVRQLHLFQRTPAWVVPRRDRPLFPLEHVIFRAAPALQRAMRGAIYAVRELSFLGFRHPRVGRLFEWMAMRHLEAQVSDAALRAKLVPDFRIGCKRILVSNDYYPALVQPNVELITSGIAEVRERSVVGRDGTEREVDAIIFGTGFRPTDPPLAPCVRGRDGRSLTEAWGGSMRAHAGTTVHGFPNLFLIPGPNTGLGHTSVLYMMEAQLAHVMSALDHMERTHGGALEPRAEAQAAYVAEIDRRMADTVWVRGGCASWYLDATGRNSTLWPDFTWRYRRRVAVLRPTEYVVTPARRGVRQAVAAG